MKRTDTVSFLFAELGLNPPTLIPASHPRRPVAGNLLLSRNTQAADQYHERRRAPFRCTGVNETRGQPGWLLGCWEKERGWGGVNPRWPTGRLLLLHRRRLVMCLIITSAVVVEAELATS